jgi:sucrose-6-phosphate hydrolase SacC (GH32 family)
MSDLSIQSLPRELSLAEDQTLRIRPQRELETLRHDPVVSENVTVTHIDRTLLADRTPKGQKIVDLASDSMEVQITIPRTEALGKLFGFTVYSDGRSSLGTSNLERGSAMTEPNHQQPVIMNFGLARHERRISCNR